jgi:hypothetical protein
MAIREVEVRAVREVERAREEGKKAAAEEQSLENGKLRELIESLRLELTQKSKRLIELQFEVEELLKMKKRMGNELEEANSKALKEREGQREM